MPARKYDAIYKSLREKIEGQEYPCQCLLPSEFQLSGIYHCTRNTARRAIRQLADEGYVRSIHGKGVQVIYEPQAHTEYVINSLESLKEIARKRGLHYYTKVILFTRITVDARTSQQTLFPVGTEVYYLQRVRYLEDTAMVIDHNYFRVDMIPGLTKEIAERSVYEYLEQELGMTIAATTRSFTVERATRTDETYMELNGYNCLAVVRSNTCTGDGILFEHTQSRHRADRFLFIEQVYRKV